MRKSRLAGLSKFLLIPPAIQTPPYILEYEDRDATDSRRVSETEGGPMGALHPKIHVVDDGANPKTAQHVVLRLHLQRGRHSVAAGILCPAFGLLFSPIIAAAAMPLLSVSVVGNALRLHQIRL